MRDMSRGSIAPQMAVFSLPLMLGSMLQQLYGIINAAAAGRYLGKEALAAVGTAVPVMNVMTFLLVGMTIGASILLAEFFGAGRGARLLDELATSLVCGLVFTLLLSAAGIAGVGAALRLIRVPAGLAPLSSSYLVIIFSGLAFVFLNNMLSSAMRAVGESAAPFWLLALSIVLNIGLSVLLVGRCGLGVRGAAWATVVSQAAAALGSVVYIYRRLPCLQLRPGNFHLDLSLLGKTASYGCTSGLQQTLIYAGVAAMQGAINPLGVDAIAAFNAVSFIDGFALAPGDSLAVALMMFISQNAGAGRFERVRAGLRQALVMNYAVTAACGLLLFTCPAALMSIFLKSGEQASVALGSGYLRVMGPIYLLSAFCNVLQGFFRGLGRMGVVFRATVVQMPVRVALTYLLAPRLGIFAAAAGIGTGWFFMALYQTAAYGRGMKTGMLPTGAAKAPQTVPAGRS